MKLFTTIFLSFLLLPSCQAKSSKATGTSLLQNDSIHSDVKIKKNHNTRLVEPIYEVHETVLDQEPLNSENLSFSEIISGVPITPLPFGISNLDEIAVSYPSRSLLNAPIGYDEGNQYGLNSYFYEHPELDPWVEYDGKHMPSNEYGGKTFFSRRLPDLSTGEKILVYYHTQPEKIRIGTANGESHIENWTSEKWVLVVCNPNGKILSTNPNLFSADNYMRLSYIDKDYNICTKHYQEPALRPSRSDRTPKGEVDDVSEEIIKKKYTTLFHESYYKLQSPKNKTSDSTSYTIQYLWIDNKPMKVK